MITEKAARELWEAREILSGSVPVVGVGYDIVGVVSPYAIIRVLWTDNGARFKAVASWGDVTLYGPKRDDPIASKSDAEMLTMRL